MKPDPSPHESKGKSLTITVPEAIAVRADLSLVEKIALSIIVRYARCSNQKLARELGLSVRGVENLLVRLRRHNLIRQVGNGSARTLRLTFPVEHHTSCENSESPQTTTKCGTAEFWTHLAVAKEHIAECSFEYFALRREMAANCMAAGEYDAALAHLAKLRQIAERDLAAAIREGWLAILTDDETVLHGLKLIDETGASRTQRTVAMAALGRATSEQLAVLRRRLDDGAALGNPIAALTLCS